MRSVWLKRMAVLLTAALVVAALGWFAWPRPVAVDIAAVVAAPMAVTVDEEGKTRVRHIYTVSAPVAGKVLRTSRHVGDEVVADETVVAVMEPVRPGFHDVRTHEELVGALSAAEAAVRLAEAEVRRMEATLDFSRSELRRAEALSKTDSISLKAMDKAKFDVQTGEAALASAKAQLEVRRSERASAAARLIDPGAASDGRPIPTCCVQMRAPRSGRVLALPQESERVVQAGTPLIEIGDPRDLEIVADLLSPDAVQVRPGAPVRIDGWGGPPLRGRVARVDPAGFMKVSALGIEEQRVKTVIDITDPPETWSALGHDFRVVVHIATWNTDKALVVPVGALFRAREQWTVFVVTDGRARLRPVEIGHRDGRTAEVLSGLQEGDDIVLHPSDRVRDGIAVAARQGR
jgi:HlyD family secretion protein